MTAIIIYNFLIFTPIISLSLRRNPQQLQALKQITAKKMAQKTLMKARQASPVWIQTNDQKITPIDKRKIVQLEILQTLLIKQKEENSQTNPLNASMLSKDDLELLISALNALAEGTFDQYYKKLDEEYQKTLKDKNLKESKLRKLINLAETMNAQGLSAIIASYFLPYDMQRYLMIPPIVSPVIDYLKNEIIKKNNLNHIVLEGHQSPGAYAKISKNGNVIITADEGDNNNLIIWNGSTGKLIKKITVPDGTINDIEISPDGGKIVTITEKKIESNDNIKHIFSTIILWNATNGKPIKTLDIPQGLSSTQFTTDGTKIIIDIDGDYEINIVDFLNPNNPDNMHKAKKSHVCVIDAITGNTIITHELEEIEQDAYTIIDPQGKSFIIATENILYDLTTGNMIAKLNGPTQEIFSANYSQDGKKIIYLDTETDNVFIWDASTGVLSKQMKLGVKHAILNFDGTKMLVSNYLGKLDLWNLTDETIIQSFQGNQIFSALALSTDGTIAISAGEGEHNIIAWNINSGKQLCTFNGHSNINELTFSTNGKILLSHSAPNEGDNKCTMMLWNIETEKLIHAFIDIHEHVSSSADLLSTVSSDNTNDHNFILWTPFSNEDKETFNQIENNLNLVQARFLYQLYTAKISGVQLSAVENKDIFITLPENIQNMIRELFNSYLPTK